MYNEIQCCHWEIGNKEGDFIVEISNFSKIKIRFLSGDINSGWVHGSCQKRQYLGALYLYQIIMCFWQGNIQLTRVISGKATEKEYREFGGETSWPMTPFNSQRYVVLLNHALNLISQQTFNQVGKAKKNKSSDCHHLHLKTVPPLWYSLYNNIHVVAPLI